MNLSGPSMYSSIQVKILPCPFCAVMCAIRTSSSICGVHTYGRRLEQKELGTGIDLQSTIETGWTLRDRRDVQSFAVLHGSQFELDLYIRIECTNHLGDDLIIETSHKLLPFGTLMLLPQELSPEIVEHLDGEMGHAKVHIDGLSGVFPRMLCGNFLVGEKQSSALTTAQELQFTHTNFDFSSIVQPDSISPLGYYNQSKIISKFHAIGIGDFSSRDWITVTAKFLLFLINSTEMNLLNVKSNFRF